MRIPEREVHDLALDVGPVADPADLENALETFGDTVHHVGYEAADQPLKGTVLFLFAQAVDDDLVGFDLDFNTLRELARQLALGPLDAQRVPRLRNLGSLGNLNGQFPDS